MRHTNKILDSRRKLHPGPVQVHPAGGRRRMRRRRPGRLETGRGLPHTAPLQQMHNRGNGKGGGISAVGLVPEQLGVDKKTLESHYLVQVAYLKDEVGSELEKEFIQSTYDVHSSHAGRPIERPTRSCSARLEVTPPTVVRYFCRAKKDGWTASSPENELKDIDRRAGRGRVRQPDQLRDQPEVLRGQRDAGVRHVPGPEHADHEDRRLRRGRHPLLQDGGLQGEHLDRASEISHQGPGLASRRSASVHGAGRGAGAQRRPRQLRTRSPSTWGRRASSRCS